MIGLDKDLQRSEPQSEKVVYDRDFTQALGVFARNENVLASVGWGRVRSIQDIDVGGYWLTKGGYILKIPRSHAESIDDLPDLVKMLFNHTASRSEGPLRSKDFIREAFMKESNWMRFRVHQSKRPDGQISWLIDITLPIDITPGQSRMLSALKSLKNTTTNIYQLDPSGTHSIASREKTPLREVRKLLDLEVDPESASLHVQCPQVRKILKQMRTGD